MKTSQPQVIATIGPSSADIKIMRSMMEGGMDVARLNFGWGTLEEHQKHVDIIREVEKESGKKILVIVDLPGPRIQKKKGHTYDKNEKFLFTPEDIKYIEFGIKNSADYFALSFVGSSEDIVDGRKIIKELNGNQLIIAKIERQKALDNLDEIIAVSDAIMIARGDLGEEIPLETIPFVQNDIIKKLNLAGKPVITATQMMYSMTENLTPTRAEVNDVADAVLEGSDAVMLSDETASGKNPVESVVMMKKIVIESEKHVDRINPLNLLKCLE